MILSQLHINSHTQIHSKKVTGIAIVCVHIYEDTEKVVRRSEILLMTSVTFGKRNEDGQD